MKRQLLLLTICLLLLHSISIAQVQWFQNQDGENLYPNGTVATSMQPLTKTAFVASYFWHIENDQFTWKISKTNVNGVEQKTFFVTGTTVQADVRTGHRNTVYVLKKDYPLGLDPQYTLYKLDSNLVVVAERSITFTDGFTPFALNVFKLDNNDNIYIAGDGQVPDGPGFLPSSFILKMDKNMNSMWMKMDPTQTSYTDVHIDGDGYVWIVEDYFGNFPNVVISKRSSSGNLKWKKTIATDAGRFSLSSTVLEDDNMLIYGGKSITENAQGIYVWKVAKTNGNIVYKKTHFPANGVQLNDLKHDRSGNIFALVTQYFNPGKMVTRVGRIGWNGHLAWIRSFPFNEDSCNLFRMIMNDNDRFYIVGEKKRNNILSRGFAMRIKKNGHIDEEFISPDSVAFLRSHWLIDGITDRDNQLIAIGLTQDLDTTTYQSTYLRSFVVKLGRKNRHNDDCYRGAAVASNTVTEIETAIKPGRMPVVYPNPVQRELTVDNLADQGYNRLSVYDLQGSLVLQRSVNSNTVRIDVNNLPGGVYMLQLQSAVLQQQKTIRFVVQK
jgi:hypothetical protein